MLRRDPARASAPPPPLRNSGMPGLASPAVRQACSEAACSQSRSTAVLHYVGADVSADVADASHGADTSSACGKIKSTFGKIKSQRGRGQHTSERCQHRKRCLQCADTSLHLPQRKVYRPLLHLTAPRSRGVETLSHTSPHPSPRCVETSPRRGGCVWRRRRWRRRGGGGGVRREEMVLN